MWNNPDIAARAAEAARYFVNHEGQFHLGMLPTEQSHPYTTSFGEVVKRDPRRGVRQLLAVDADIPAAARRLFLSASYERLVSMLRQAAVAGRRVCFSGCGSTGRLSVMLEEMWRRFWEEHAQVPRGAAAALGGSSRTLSAALRWAVDRANLVCSIATGGDRALVRSVEQFEDYAQFGARQVADIGLQQGDVVVAITEGGETSSVIGTIEEGLARGCDICMVYNNPTAILNAALERSRRVIMDERVTTLDLFTGAMALSGSTRMQATTIEMLMVGSAIEEALTDAAQTQDGTRQTPLSEEARYRARLARADHYAALIDQLGGSDNSALLAELAVAESEIYRQKGFVTYYASQLLLDIFSDTTERTPTFAIPPFRRDGDIESSPSWAFAKDPARTTIEAWHAMLRRTPRGLTWDAEEYRRMEAPAAIAENPPLLDLDEIYRYMIGNEPDGRMAGIEEERPQLKLMISVDMDEVDAPPSPPLQSSPLLEGVRHFHLTDRDASSDADYPLRIDIPPSPIALWHHLALKIIFNTVSTATMGIMGRIRGNWMIQVNPTNKKLIDRGSRIIAECTGLSYLEACTQLHISMMGPHQQISGGDSIVARAIHHWERTSAHRHDPDHRSDPDLDHGPDSAGMSV